MRTPIKTPRRRDALADYLAARVQTHNDTIDHDDLAELCGIRAHVAIDADSSRPFRHAVAK